MYAVGEECPEVGTAGGHDGPVNGEVSVLDAYDGVAQQSVLAQVVQYVARLQHARQHNRLFMVALCNRGAIIFLALSFLSSIYLLSSFFSSPNLSGRRLDVYHTSTHGVALVRI